MSSLIRRLAAPEVDLPARYADVVTVFAIGDGQTAAAPLVPAGALREAIAERASASLLAFVYAAAEGREPVDQGPDGALITLLSGFDPTRDAAVIRFVPAVDALKKVQDGQVVEAMDRSKVNLLRSPEVIRRSMLAAAVESLDEDKLVNPTALLASTGAQVRIIRI